MSTFDQGGFGDDLFGSPYKIGRGTTTGKSATSAQVHRLSRPGPVLSAGTSASSMAALRRRFGQAVVTGLSHTGTAVVRRKPVAFAATGSSHSTCAWLRRRGNLQLLSIGIGSTHAAVRRLLQSQPWITTGTSDTTAVLFLLALPSPSNALRVAPWTRPTANVDLRFQGWTAPR